MLRWRTGSHHAGRLGVVAAGTTGPQRLGAIVEMIRGCWSLYHEVEDSRAAHHLDRPLERKIGESLTIAPDYHVAGLQACRARGSAFPRALNVRSLQSGINVRVWKSRWKSSVATDRIHAFVKFYLSSADLIKLDFSSVLVRGLFLMHA